MQECSNRTCHNSPNCLGEHGKVHRLGERYRKVETDKCRVCDYVCGEKYPKCTKNLCIPDGHEEILG